MTSLRKVTRTAPSYKSVEKSLVARSDAPEPSTYDAPLMQTRETRMAHAGWTQNLIQAGRLRPRERVLVVVDEPLAAEGAELLAAVQDAGGHGRLELWTGDRPLAKAPQ